MKSRKLLKKIQEKQSIEDETTSHQFKQSPYRPHEEQSNFIMRNQRKGKIF